MDAERLNHYIDSHHYTLDFKADGTGMMWGVSHVRLAIGSRNTFENIEHFFFSTLHSDESMTLAMPDGASWLERTDLKQWALNLTITEVKKEALIRFIEKSSAAIQQHRASWESENSIDMALLDTLKAYEECVLIKENFSPRHHINTTETYLALDQDNYYYFEAHYES